MALTAQNCLDNITAIDAAIMASVNGGAEYSIPGSRTVKKVSVTDLLILRSYYTKQHTQITKGFFGRVTSDFSEL
jgi:hypothetical protein